MRWTWPSCVIVKRPSQTRWSCWICRERIYPAWRSAISCLPNSRTAWPAARPLPPRLGALPPHGAIRVLRPARSIRGPYGDLRTKCPASHVGQPHEGESPPRRAASRNPRRSSEFRQSMRPRRHVHSIPFSRPSLQDFPVPVPRPCSPASRRAAALSKAAVTDEGVRRLKESLAETAGKTTILR